MATAVSPPAPTVHPSSFAQYPYFQPLNTQSAYGYIDPALGVNTDGLANLQIHGNAYLPQAMGNQFQFTQGMAPYTLAQFPIQQNNYQWPLSNANNELNTTASGVVGEDTR